MATGDWTDAQLRLAVAKELKVLRQDASAMRADWDAELVTKSAQVRATLITLELCFWTAAAIPLNVQLPLTYLVAQAAKSFWGRDSYNEGAGGMVMLEMVCAAAPRGERTKSEAF